MRHFRIGWAPEGWDVLAGRSSFPTLERQGGRARVNASARQNDFFRARVLFPIYDDRNDPVGFGGRILPTRGPGTKASTRTPETRLYDKSKILYGLNWAKKEVVTVGRP